MEHAKTPFDSPAAARAYLRSIAFGFDDPEELVRFLRACETVQAALVHWLVEQHRYDRQQKSCFLEGGLEREEKLVELKGLWERYNEAEVSFDHSLEKLKEAIRCLEPYDGSGFSTEGGES